MATGFKYSGKRLPVASASGAISSGDFVVQEKVFGVALTDIASGSDGWLGVEGVWNMAVPANTAKGDLLYLSGAAITTDAINPTLKRTGATTGDTFIGIAMSDRDAAGFADVFLGPQGTAAL